MPPSLMDMASQVFLFVAAFRRKAARAAPMTGDLLHAEAVKMFRELDHTAQRDPALKEAWAPANRALVYLVDEIMTTAEWEHRGWWDDNVLESCVLGNPQKMRGILFFDDLAEARKQFSEAGSSVDDAYRASVLTVFYCCLRFGFEGKFAGQTQQLQREAKEIHDLLPTGSQSESKTLFEEAYRHTVQISHSKQGSGRLPVLLAVVAGFAILVMGLRTVLWNELLEELHTAAEQAGNVFGG